MLTRRKWFKVTDGAASYDGVHYGMQVTILFIGQPGSFFSLTKFYFRLQVNMEKVQLLLNLLDIGPSPCPPPRTNAPHYTY